MSPSSASPTAAYRNLVSASGQSTTHSNDGPQLIATEKNRYILIYVEQRFVYV